VIRRKLLTLILLTSVAFAVIQGMRLATGEEWSWITTIAYGIALAFQVAALLTSPAGRDC
jgi:hypothetical protein